MGMLSSARQIVFDGGTVLQNAFGVMVQAPTAIAAGFVRLLEATANGTNYVDIRGALNHAADRVMQLADTNVTMPAGVGAQSTILDQETAQTISGAKTYADAAGPFLQDQAAGAFSTRFRGPANLTANRVNALQDCAYTFPAGVANASTLADLQTAQTFAGAKLFAEAGGLSIQDQAAGASGFRIRGAANHTAPRVMTMPDATVAWPAGVGNVCTPVDLESAQILTGAKRFAEAGGLEIQDQAAGVNAFRIRGAANHTALRVMTLPDATVAWPAGVGNVCTPVDLESAQGFTGAKTTTQGVAAGTALTIGGRAVSAVGGVPVTNTNTEDISRTHTIPASSLTAGKVLRLRWMVRVTAKNAAETLTIRVRLNGVGGTVLQASGAVNVAATNVAFGQFYLSATAAPGAAVAVVGGGEHCEPAATGGAMLADVPASANFATNGALDLVATLQWSAANPGNVASFELFDVEIS